MVLLLLQDLYIFKGSLLFFRFTMKSFDLHFEVDFHPLSLLIIIALAFAFALAFHIHKMNNIFISSLSSSCESTRSTSEIATVVLSHYPTTCLLPAQHAWRRSLKSL